MALNTGTTAVTSSSAGKQLLKLGTRLVVGIQLDSTLLHFPERHYAAKYKLRPHLRYFGSMLHKLKCEVALFTKTSRYESEHLLRRFRSEFNCPLARLVHDSGELYYQEILSEIAEEILTRGDRAIFIDAKASHTASLKQTLVLEPFLPVKRLRGSEKARDGALPEHKTVALTIDDYTLIALAEMVKEMATTDIPVATYLQMEPLVETVRVPMYGDVQALPIENCDHIEQLDLSKLEVSEPLQWSPEDIVETPEHSQMFK